MPNQTEQETLEALKFELKFIEFGGYDPSVRNPRKELHIFRDSPSCLNYAAEVRTEPCSECFLMSFLPPEKRGESVPCHHIPLNARGDTVETLAGSGDSLELREAMRSWLHQAIGQLEGKPAEPKR
jgi:hypothetical protein